MIWAFLLGGISAVSLPLGSWVALRWRIASAYISSLAAFGAGALLAALSVELVAPTLFALDQATEAAERSEAGAQFYALIFGALLGGVLFVLLDQLVSAKGGFLRRTATAVSYFQRQKHKRQAHLVEQLGSFPLLRKVPAADINTLVPLVKPATFNDGDLLFEQGETAERIFFLLEGTVTADNASSGSLRFRSGETVGLAQVIVGIPVIADAVANGTVVALALARTDLERLRRGSPDFDKACQDFVTKRLARLERRVTAKGAQEARWLRNATRALQSGARIPGAEELRQARRKHQGAPLAIWLGMLLDGIPESFVIGAGVFVTIQTHASLPTAVGPVSFAQIVPYTLIAGLFLSNFPEALASSSAMRMHGMKPGRILWLWISLMLITAAGAAGGFLLADILSHTFLIFAEGVAAGAMLTMIASAMIPEAVHLGRANIVGLSTLLGFIAAISFKLLE